MASVTVGVGQGALLKTPTSKLQTPEKIQTPVRAEKDPGFGSIESRKRPDSKAQPGLLYSSRIQSRPMLRNPVVRAVAKRFRLRLFTGAPGDRFLFRDFRLQGFDAGSFMRPVTKRLGLGTPAGAPPISSGLDGLDDG